MVILLFVTLYYNVLKRFIAFLESLKLPILEKYGRELLQIINILLELICQSMSRVQPKRNLGQHFLKDTVIASRIAGSLTGIGYRYCAGGRSGHGNAYRFPD